MLCNSGAVHVRRGQLLCTRALTVIMLYFLSVLDLVATAALATPILYDGRAPYSYTNDDLNNSVGPYLS